MVPDLKMDTLSYNSELFGLLGTNNTVLTGDKVQHKYQHLVAKFGAGACLVKSKINQGYAFLAGTYHTQTSLLGLFNATTNRIYFNACCSSLVKKVILNENYLIEIGCKAHRYQSTCLDCRNEHDSPQT